MFISHVSPSPPPHSQLLYVNPLITSAAPPLPHTRFRRSGSCECGQLAAIWRSSPSGFPYKRPQIFSSSCGVLEVYNPFPLVLATNTVHFFLRYSIEVSSFHFSITLSVLAYCWLSCNAIEPPLTLGVQGACLPIPSDVPLVIWHMGDNFLEKNTSQHGIFWIVFNPNLSSFLVITWLFNLTLICLFAQDLIFNAICYYSLLFSEVLW